MLETIGFLLATLDKVVQMLRLPREKRRRVFEGVAKELYTSMKEVHDDYLRFFKNASEQLKSGEDPQNVLENLRARRVAEEMERSSVIERTKAILEVGAHSDVKGFLQAVENYFRETPFSGNDTPSTVLIETLDGRLRGGCDDEELRECVEQALECVRDNWIYLSRAYGTLEGRIHR